MAKLVTYRYEYALYDDAQGALNPGQQIPPRYPPTLDTFAAGSVFSALSAFGSQRLVSASGALTYVSLPGAALTVVADMTNTTLLHLQQTSVVPSPGAGATQLYMPVGPGQTLTLPGPLNSGTIVVQPVTPAFAATTAAWGLTVFVTA